MKEYLDVTYWGEPFIYMVLCFALFLMGKVCYQLLHPNIDVDAEMVDKDNFAFAITHVGYYIGLLLAIAGMMSGSGHNTLTHDLLLTGGYGIAAIVLLNIAILLNDRLIFSGLELKKNIIERGNVAVGIVEAGNSVANGLIIYGVLSVEADHIFYVLAFWVFAQAVLILTAWLYNRLMPYPVFDKIYTNNVAVAVAATGFLLAIANILRYIIQVEHGAWYETAVVTLIELGIAFLVLPIFRLLTDKLLLPKRRITDELVNQETPNVGVGLVEALAYVSGSILITISL